MLEIFDFIAVMGIQIGNYLKIKKLSTGWLLSMCSIAYFIVRALGCNFWSQSIGHMISFCMALYGFIAWRKK